MAVRNDFSSGEVLTAADLNDTFASKVDYATPTNAQTGTAYTFVADDAERLTTASNGSAVTFTIPPQSSVTWGDDTILRVVNYGAGALTVDGGSGVTVTNTATTVAQYQAAAAIRTGSDAWTLVPFAGGGEIPAAEISSPAATGQYTDTGITYDYYTFTSSGTLTVDTGGFADILVVGGGGGGGMGCSGGGGAGGHLYVTDAYLPTGTLTVTVGAGGAGRTAPSQDSGYVGNSGIASRLDSYISPGGGGSGSQFYNAVGTGYSGAGINGGSGGGAGRSINGTASGGAGISGLGNNGGTGGFLAGGGGGGAGAVGQNASGGSDGGAGTANSITGSSVTRAGGGGGGVISGTAGSGGTGGGGAGGSGGTDGTDGTANTGGGGGGTGEASTSDGGNGGSGVVIVRVRTN